MYCTIHCLMMINDFAVNIVLSRNLLLIMMLPCITTSSLLTPALIIAHGLTKSVFGVFVVASPGRVCHLFRLSVCFKGGATLWMTP